METKIARYVRLIKQGVTDYKWTLYYFQMLILNPNNRNLIGFLWTYLLPKSPKRKINLQIQKDIQTLKENGLVVLDNFVTKAQIEDIKSYLSTKLCIDRQRPGNETFIAPRLAPKSCIHAYYRLEEIVHIPHLLELANEKRILAIIEEIFGAKPTISMIHIWWLLSGFDTHANSNERYFTHPGEFHRDVDDWSEIKLFIYLTDVNESSGPHAYIKKSHKWVLPPKTRDLDINNPDFPIKENLIKLTGKAGLAWLENSYVLHRSLVPKNKHRLIVAVTYTLFPLPFGPKVPLRSCSDPNQFDPYINRIYLKYR